MHLKGYTAPDEEPEASRPTKSRYALAALLPLRRNFRRWVNGSLTSDMSIQMCQEAIDSNPRNIVYYLKGPKVIRATMQVGWALRERYTMLHLAARNSNVPLDILRLILESYPRAVVLANVDGRTPLHLLCMRTPANGSRRCFGNCYSSLQLLLDAFPGAAALRDNFSKTPLHHLMRYHSSCMKTIRALLAACHAAAALPDIDGNMPIHLLSRFADPAAWREAEACAELLLAARDRERKAVVLGTPVQLLESVLLEADFSEHNTFEVGELVAVAVTADDRAATMGGPRARYHGLGVGQVEEVTAPPADAYSHAPAPDDDGETAAASAAGTGRRQRYLVRTQESSTGPVYGKLGTLRSTQILHRARTMDTFEIGKLIWAPPGYRPPPPPSPLGRSSSVYSGAAGFASTRASEHESDLAHSRPESRMSGTGGGGAEGHVQSRIAGPAAVIAARAAAAAAAALADPMRQTPLSLDGIVSGLRRVNGSAVKSLVPD